MTKNRSRLVTIFGGQFGSEGKGQVAAFLVERSKFDIAVRVGGPNAGHTFYYPNGRKEKVQSVPVAAMLGAQGVIGPAGVILPQLLLEELQRGLRANGKPVRLVIDNNAAIITQAMMDSERELVKSIGSTGEGVGAATAAKVMRQPITVSDQNLIGWLSEQDGAAAAQVAGMADTASYLNMALITGNTIMLEGTQGFGLSLHTGGFYPKCTSRECTPNAIWAETGVNSGHAGQVETIMVVRTYPIRVAGNSGPLKGEITWDELRARTHGYVAEPEITTVTRKIRRIGELDWELLQRAVLQTQPTAIALMFFDYLFPEVAQLRDASGLERRHWDWLRDFESRVGVSVKLLGCGPNNTLPLRVTL